MNNFVCYSDNKPLTARPLATKPSSVMPAAAVFITFYTDTQTPKFNFYSSSVSSVKNRHMRTVDYMIVGQGLAGTLMAYRCIEQGKSCIVVDATSGAASSRVAAGIWNPVVFKRLNMSWLYPQLQDELLPTYRGLEQLLNISIVQELDIVKLFSTEDEVNKWQEKTVLSDFDSILSLDKKEEMENSDVLRPIGYGTAKGGRIDLKRLLDAFREFLRSNDQLLEEQLDYSALDIATTGVSYKNITAKHIVFCEGSTVHENPWFKDLPHGRTKGEVLTLHIPELHIQSILNKAAFVLPLGDDCYKVGATFAWKYEHEGPTEEGKEELFGKINKFLPYTHTLLDHTAGMRPTVKDRRPILGAHPENNNLFIFNGLGTKGVMLAPYFSKQLLAHIETKEPLHPEVDIKRFHRA